jgi:hypothetical protein
MAREFEDIKLIHDQLQLHDYFMKEIDSISKALNKYKVMRFCQEKIPYPLVINTPNEVGESWFKDIGLLIELNKIVSSKPRTNFTDQWGSFNDKLTNCKFSNDDSLLLTDSKGNKFFLSINSPTQFRIYMCESNKMTIDEVMEKYVLDQFKKENNNDIIQQFIDATYPSDEYRNSILVQLQGHITQKLNNAKFEVLRQETNLLLINQNILRQP